jgi:formiminotetrahydrofolate cyclodeaminase
MVARLTIKKKYRPVSDQMTEILNQAERMRHELTEAVMEDSRFEVVMAAQPKEHLMTVNRMVAAESHLNAAQVHWPPLVGGHRDGAG